MPFKGRQVTVALKKETTRLTAETTGFTKFPMWEEFSSMNKNEMMTDESSVGSRGKKLNGILAYQTNEHKLGGKLDADSILPWLYYALGTATPTTALGATTWVMSLLESLQLPTYTIQFDGKDEGPKRIRGGAVKSLKLSWKLNEASYSVDGEAIIEETGQAQTASYVKPDKYLLGRDVKVYYATSLGGLGSIASPTGTLVRVTSVDVTIETGLDVKKQLEMGNGIAAATDNLADGFSIKIDLNTVHSNVNSATAFQTAHDTDVNYAFRIDALNPNAPVIGTSTLRPRITMDFPPSSINVERNIPLDDLINQKISIEVEMPQLSTFQLINSVSSNV
jgi:hypothetical protein